MRKKLAVVAGIVIFVAAILLLVWLGKRTSPNATGASTPDPTLSMLPDPFDSPLASAATTVKGLRLRLLPVIPTQEHGAVFVAGGDLSFLAQFMNTSDAPFHLHGASWEPAMAYEINDVQSSNKWIADFTRKLSPKDKHYYSADLQPGASTPVGIVLGQNHNFRRKEPTATMATMPDLPPSEYTLVVTWTFDAPSVDQAIPCWTGKITSEPVAFVISESSPQTTRNTNGQPSTANQSIDSDKKNTTSLTENETQPLSWTSVLKGETVGFVRMKYAGAAWDDGMDSDSNADVNFLKKLHELCGVPVAAKPEYVTIDTLKNRKERIPPVLYMTGSKSIRTSRSDAQTLRKYLLKDGMLFADCGHPQWHKSFIQWIRTVLPDKSLVEIANDDLLFREPYKFPNGAPPMWNHGGRRTLGIKHEGRWIVVYHPGDINDAWKSGHSGVNAALAEAAFQFGINVTYYAWKHQADRLNSANQSNDSDKKYATRLTEHNTRALSALTTEIEKQKKMVANSQEHLDKLPVGPASRAERQRVTRDLENKKLLLQLLKDRLALEQKERGLHAQVPASSHQEQTAVAPESVTRGEIIVNVLADGRLRVEGKMMDDAEVAKRFKSIAEKFPNQPVRISVDKQTTYQNMVRVIDLFRKSGIVNISFANTKPDNEQIKAAYTWKNVPAILVPSPPGATPTKQWRLQALIDETSLYLRFRYPEALPSVGKNLANSFAPTSKSLNQLPYIKLFVPPESLSNYAERPKATLPDGTKIYFAQVGDPKPQFGIHAGFFLRSKAPDGRQNAKSGGAFDRKDLVQGYQSVVIGIQGYVKSLKQGGKRTDYRYEGGDEPSQFVMEESGFIFIVPLAHGKGEDGQTLEPTLSKPLTDLSLRVYPSGSNHFKLYLPKRISAKIKQVSSDAIDKVVSGINERSSLYNWGNDVYMAVVLPKEAKPEKVVDSILSRSRDKNLDCKVIEIRKVTIQGSTYWAALVTIDSIQKVILFKHSDESNGWWALTYPVQKQQTEDDAPNPPADQMNNTSSSPVKGKDADYIAALVARLNDDVGLWKNGIYRAINLPAGAKAQEVLNKALESKHKDSPLRKKHKVVEVRKVTINQTAYFAVLLDYPDGSSVFLCEYNSGGAWWSRFYKVSEKQQGAAPEPLPQEAQSVLDRLNAKCASEPWRNEIDIIERPETRPENRVISGGVSSFISDCKERLAKHSVQVKWNSQKKLYEMEKTQQSPGE